MKNRSFCSILLAGLLCCGLATALTSCEEYLDIKPYGRTVPKTTEEFSALLHQMCDAIDKGNIQGELFLGSCGLTEELEAVSDNMATNLTGGTDRLTLYIGQYLSSKQTAYRDLYEQIRNCNIILDNYEEGLDSREGRDIVGTVYALRGLCYYQLLRMFCAPPLAADAQLGVPLVLEFNMEAQPLRSTMQETISQAESDLKTALTYDVQNPMYLVNNDVVHGFLARLYHWCGRWQEARREARLVLAAHPLLPADDYVKMMSTQYGLVGNKLIMSERIIDPSRPTVQSVAMSYMEQRPLSADFVNLFTEGTRDIRRKNNLFFNRKRKNRKFFFSGLRSAEMALVAMESAYHLNLLDSALTELNDFRSHRITEGDYAYTMQTLPPVDTETLVQQDATGQALTPLLQAILRERRKELYLENGDRWFELKRNGRPEFWVGINGQKFWTRRFMYTWPLQVQDIQLQPGLIQNPGYEETY